jgi:hypothetical protein
MIMSIVTYRTGGMISERKEEEEEEEEEEVRVLYECISVLFLKRFDSGVGRLPLW